MTPKNLRSTAMRHLATSRRRCLALRLYAVQPRNAWAAKQPHVSTRAGPHPPAVRRTFVFNRRSRNINATRSSRDDVVASIASMVAATWRFRVASAFSSAVMCAVTRRRREKPAASFTLHARATTRRATALARRKYLRFRHIEKRRSVSARGCAGPTKPRRARTWRFPSTRQTGA